MHAALIIFSLVAILFFGRNYQGIRRYYYLFIEAGYTEKVTLLKADYSESADGIGYRCQYKYKVRDSMCDATEFVSLDTFRLMKPGDQVNLYRSATRPEIASIRSRRSLLYEVIIAVGMNLLLLLAVIYLIVYFWRKGKVNLKLNYSG